MMGIIRAPFQLFLLQKIKAFSSGIKGQWWLITTFFRPYFTYFSKNKRCLISPASSRDPRHQILSMEAISEYVSLAQVLANHWKFKYMGVTWNGGTHLRKHPYIGTAMASQWTTLPTTHPASGLVEDLKGLPTPLKFEMDTQHYDRGV